MACIRPEKIDFCPIPFQLKGVKRTVMNGIDSDSTTPSAFRTTIPIALTSFVGRKHDLAEVRRLLAASRLLTLTGAAGCGKTRLALRIATEVNREYTDGVHCVELARLADPALVSQRVAKVFHVAEQRDRSIVEGLLEALQDKQLLLVLDNCEHVVSACAQLAETLLAGTEIRMLATSREPLGTTGEMRYPVSPMALPPRTLRADEVAHFDAIQLFVERARASVPAFALTADNAGVVASICRKLDGLPLAIELASARVNILTVEQIAARLDDRFGLLGGAPHVTQRHHRTLRAALDWSYDFLATSEQIMLRRLTVFTGGCSLATAETVCAGDGVEREQVLELLSSLVDKSLVVAHTLQRGEARYALLETIRQYAHEKLIASGEWSAIRDRHLHCFLQLAEETVPKLRGPYQQLWLDWLEGEYDNIRAALSWALERERLEAGLRIANAMYQFWTVRDYVQEGLAWVERLLAQADERVAPVVRVTALAYASLLAGFRGNNPKQMRYGREAAVVAEAAGDANKPALAMALGAQAYAARAAGDYQNEFTINKRVIQLRREVGDAYLLGVALSTTSFTAMSLGNYAEARALLDEGLPLLRALGDRYRIAMALNFSGDLARCEQQYAQAQRAYEESIAHLRELGAVRDLASVLHNLGHTCLHLGDVERAHALFSQSMAAQLAQRNTPGVAECLIGFAAMAAVGHLPAAGARLLAAAVAIGGQRVATMWAATRMEYEQYLALVRANLTETEFQTEQAAGRAFSLEQAVAYAQHLPLKAAAAHGTGKKVDALTVREREVAALVAQGKSNGEIADQLVVGKRTVEKHIANILSKRGFTNRAQIVRWAIEAGQVKSRE
jgi:predicted ATPase/DNA-binding NarL/FixJ family response regulator